MRGSQATLEESSPRGLSPHELAGRRDGDRLHKQHDCGAATACAGGGVPRGPAREPGARWLHQEEFPWALHTSPLAHCHEQRTGSLRLTWRWQLGHTSMQLPQGELQIMTGTLGL